MAFNLALADTIRSSFTRRGVQWVEQKMMGGICFMVDGKMCVGVSADRLMVRVAPEAYEEAISRTGGKPMVIGEKVLKGFVFVEPEGYDMQWQFESWIDLAIAFNPHAKSSKKRKSSS